LQGNPGAAYTPGVNTQKAKTLAWGLGKSRSGSPPISLAKLIEKTKMSSFAEAVKQAVSADEALDAAKMLSVDKKTRIRRYAEGGAIGGAAYPLVNAAGEAAGALAGHSSSGKVRAVGSALQKSFKRPELARNVTRGALGGGGVQAIRDGVELGRAQKTVQNFLHQHGRSGGSDAVRQ